MQTHWCHWVCLQTGTYLHSSVIGASDDPVVAQTIPATCSEGESAFDDDNMVGVQEQVVSVTSWQVKQAETTSILWHAMAIPLSITSLRDRQCGGCCSCMWSAETCGGVPVSTETAATATTFATCPRACKRETTSATFLCIHQESTEEMQPWSDIDQADSHEKAFLLETLDWWCWSCFHCFSWWRWTRRASCVWTQLLVLLHTALLMQLTM